MEAFLHAVLRRDAEAVADGTEFHHITNTVTLVMNLWTTRQLKHLLTMCPDFFDNVIDVVGTLANLSEAPASSIALLLKSVPPLTARERSKVLKVLIELDRPTLVRDYLPTRQRQKTLEKLQPFVRSVAMMKMLIHHKYLMADDVRMQTSVLKWAVARPFRALKPTSEMIDPREFEHVKIFMMHGVGRFDIGDLHNDYFVDLALNQWLAHPEQRQRLYLKGYLPLCERQHQDFDNEARSWFKQSRRPLRGSIGPGAIRVFRSLLGTSTEANLWRALLFHERHGQWPHAVLDLLSCATRSALEDALERFFDAYHGDGDVTVCREPWSSMITEAMMMFPERITRLAVLTAAQEQRLHTWWLRWDAPKRTKVKFLEDLTVVVGGPFEMEAYCHLNLFTRLSSKVMLTRFGALEYDADTMKEHAEVKRATKRCLPKVLENMCAEYVIRPAKKACHTPSP